MPASVVPTAMSHRSAPVPFLRRAPTVLGTVDTGRRRSVSGGRQAESSPETGLEPRSLRTRPTIRPGQRPRILMLHNGTCVLCHRNDLPLISVHDGRELGLADAELDSDENLAAMWAPCNSGVGGSREKMNTKTCSWRSPRQAISTRGSGSFARRYITKPKRREAH